MHRSALPMVWLVAALACGGCGGPQEAQAPAADTPFRPLLDDHEFMAYVLDPATDVIWGAAGYVITIEGEQSLAPVDEEGWNAVRNAAAVVAESGNLLMLPGRSRGADWNEFALGMMGLAERAMAAADARDDQAVFDIGGQLYNVCVACHQLYPETEEEEAP